MADWFNYKGMIGKPEDCWVMLGDTWYKVNVVDNKMYFNGGEV